MQPLSLTARFGRCLIVICCLSLWPCVAKASVVGDMANILEWMEDHGIQKPVPIDKIPSQDLRDSEPLINCVMSGKSVDECFAILINSPVADKASYRRNVFHEISTASSRVHRLWMRRPPRRST